MTWHLRLDVELDEVDNVDIDTIRFAMQGANPLAHFPVTGLGEHDQWGELHVNVVEVIEGPRGAPQ